MKRGNGEVLDKEGEIIPKESISDQKQKKKRTFKEFQQGKEFLFDEFFQNSSETNNNDSLSDLEKDLQPPKKKHKPSNLFLNETDENDLLKSEPLQGSDTLNINFGSSLTSDTANKISLSDLIHSLVDNSKKPKTTHTQKKNDTLKIFDNPEKGKNEKKIDEVQSSENIEILKSIIGSKKTSSLDSNTQHDDIIRERKVAYDMTKNEMNRKWGKIDKEIKNARVVPIMYDEDHKGDNDNMIEDIINPNLKFISDFNKKLHEERIKSNDNAVVVKPLNVKNVKRNEIKKEHVKMSKDELIERANELAREKRQLSYLQAKRNRINRNKSRSFRKKIRKQKDKENEKLMELGLMDEEKIKRDLEREEIEYIKERITLRHKNTSNWIRRAIKHQNVDGNLRKAVQDQLKIGQKLKEKQSEVNKIVDERRKIDEIFEVDGADERRKMLEKLKSGGEREEKGVFAMQFMKKAREKQINEMSELVREIEGGGEVKDGDGGESVKNGVEKKKKYGVVKKKKNVKLKPVEFESNTIVVPEKRKIVEIEKNIEIDVPKIEKSIVVENNDNVKIEKRGLNITDIDQMLRNERKNMKSRKRKRKSKTTYVNSTKDDNVKEEKNPWIEGFDDDESELPEWKKRKIAETKTSSKILIEKRKKKKIDVVTPNVVSGGGDDEKEKEFQRELKREAFAGDDLDLEFEKEKLNVIDSELDMPEMESLDVPGWDEWGGKGIQVDDVIVEKKKKFEEIKENIRNENIDQRSDAQLKNVIIRKTAIPDPMFFQHRQYGNTKSKKKIFDNVTSQPLGPEWNTIKGFKKVNVPRVSIPFSGKVIAPLSKKNYLKQKNKMY